MMQQAYSFADSLRVPTPRDIAQVRRRYERYYSSAYLLPFPGYRKRHPILQQLCGVQPMAPQLPAWWNDIVALMPECLRPLMERLPAADFYAGKLNPTLEQELRALGKQFATPPTWARSPRLGKLLLAMLSDASHPLYRRYEQRGYKRWQDVQIVISAHPWDILTMGTSEHFVTCQDLFGREAAAIFNEKLPANLLDSGMVVAYVQKACEDRWKIGRMKARIILRLLRTRRDHYGILLDRSYGDAGLATGLITQLDALIAACGLAHWMPPNYKGHEGIVVCLDQPFPAYGLPQQFHGLPLPYLDQGDMNQDFYWEPCQPMGGASSHRLHAAVVEVPSTFPEGELPYQVLAPECDDVPIH
jgi:hypothetical protein